ncbi:MAG: ribbon-helix-helix protein, CopG family [Methylococcaceae bacterium]|nr:MAG: ribbon-helix-helix protein, CopG family [Methylococcaceae bacterium]
MMVIPVAAWYCFFMNTLTIKIPPQLEAAILQASAQEHLSKSELVRRALDMYLRQRKSATPFISALDQAGDLVGCFSGGPADLSSPRGQNENCWS